MMVWGRSDRQFLECTTVPIPGTKGISMNTRLLPIALALMAATGAQAATISNAAGSHPIGVLDSSRSPTYGQTFTLSAARILDSWSFYVYGLDPASNVNFGIASWGNVACGSNASSNCTGQGPVASLYATSGTVAAAATTPAAQQLAFNNIGLTLAAGSYVAYVTSVGASIPANGLSFQNGVDDGGLGGGFRFEPFARGTTAQAPLPSGRAWDLYRSQGGEHLQFSASFSDPAVTPVPEPSTYALMLAGLAAVGWSARRRQAGQRLARGAA